MCIKKFFFLIIATTLYGFCFSQSCITNPLINTKGQSITTLNKSTIQLNYGRSLAQLLNDQPGIVINGAYQPLGGLNSIYMEGTLGGRALILIDGIPVMDPSSLPDYFDLNFISLYDVEQIDIYHGAQSAVMGDGAFAGAINIITTQKDFSKKMILSGSINAGNEKTTNSTLYLNLNKNKWKYSISLSSIKTKGFSQALDSTSKMNFDKDGFRGSIVNSSIEYKSNKYFKIKGSLLYSNYKADSDVDAFTDAVGYYIKNKYLKARTGFEYSKKNILIVADYQFEKYTHLFHYDTVYHENYIGTAHFAQLYFQTKIATHLTLLTGTDYRHNHMENNFYDTVSVQQHLYPSTNIISLYTKISYLTKDSSIAIDLAARLSNHNAYGNIYNYTFSSSYQFSKNIELFAGIATGFKSACMYQLYNNYGSANSNLSPEKTTDYHLGFRLKNKNIIQQLNGFYNSLTDLIYWDNNVSTYDNFNTQKTWGFQYELKWKISNPLNLTANYSFTGGSDYGVSRQNFSDVVTYPYLFRRPKHVVNIGIYYHINKFNTGLTGRYVGKNYDVNPGNSDYTIPSFFVINAYSSYNVNKRCSIYLNIQNLLNNNFYDVRGFNSTPFLLNVGLSFQLQH